MDGKRKKAFYSEKIQKYIEIRDQILREYLGDEFVDRMYEEHSDVDEKDN